MKKNKAKKVMPCFRGMQIKPHNLSKESCITMTTSFSASETFDLTEAQNIINGYQNESCWSLSTNNHINMYQ